MDSSSLTDDACERLLSGRLADAESDLVPLRWFLEDVKCLFVEPIAPAVRAMHPAAVSGPSGLDRRTASRRCKPERTWWSGGPLSE